MPFVKVDYEETKKELEELRKTSEGQKAHEEFVKACEFRGQMNAARKAINMTQKELAEVTGLKQQAISRIERGSNFSIESLLKYIDGIGCELLIHKKKR